MDTKSVLIGEILKIELHWFLTVNPQLTAECQQHPETFRLIRQSIFETWSEKTLRLYLESLIDAQSKGRNLMREKYAKIDNLIPCVNISPVIYEITKIEERWQKEALAKYPYVFKQEAGEGFVTYLRCELDAYSQVTLESYFNNLAMTLAGGRNLVIERYSRIAQKMGYSSLEEWNQQAEGSTDEHQQGQRA